MGHAGQKFVQVPKLTPTEQQSLRQVNQRTNEMAAIMAQIGGQHEGSAGMDLTSCSCRWSAVDIAHLNCECWLANACETFPLSHEILQSTAWGLCGASILEHLL